MALPDKTKKPFIAITMGDPCGIGPEILVKTLGIPNMHEDCLPLIVGDPLALHRAQRLLGSDMRIVEIQAQADVHARPEVLHVISPVKLTLRDIPYGQPSSSACRATVQYIQKAVEMAMDGQVQAVTTCPIHKAHLQRHGFSFPGHTEFLQYLTGARNVVMMLAGPSLKVSLVTIHHPLSDVPRLLTGELLSRTIQITGEALVRDFGLKDPLLAVAGLNPHAGEEGRFGHEEISIIRPVIESFEGKPFRVSGPHPSDTVFLRACEGDFDAVVAMYHDQGLIPIKLIHFHEAVNITLGLPIVRTSVDHGTAYDLAGTGKADAGSLTAAIRMAADMARTRLQKIQAHVESY